jgi:hypothetical protein
LVNSNQSVSRFITVEFTTVKGADAPTLALLQLLDELEPCNVFSDSIRTNMHGTIA